MAARDRRNIFTWQRVAAGSLLEGRGAGGDVLEFVEDLVQAADMGSCTGKHPYAHTQICNHARV